MLNPQLTFSHPKYRPDIDGLRAVAVISVVIFHAFPEWIKGGFIGVDIFFVISGFLISTIIFENLDKGTFSFSEFYARRVKRIFPALLLVLIAVLVFGWFVLLADEYKQLGKHVASGAGFISNIILWGEAGYFDNSAETKPLLHLWSLGIEEQFYIVWPLLLWFVWRQKLNLITITLLAASVSFYLNIKNIQSDAVATFYSPQTRFWELLCGSSLAWVMLYCKNEVISSFKLKIDGCLAYVIYREKTNADGKTLANFFSFVGLFLLVYGFCEINKNDSFPGAWAIVPVLGAILIIAAGSEAWINRTILSTRVLVWFGIISYPLYLWHWPLFSFARIIKNETPGITMRVCLIALSIILAWLTYKFIESPVRFGAKSKFKIIALAGLMTLVGSTGYYIFYKDGLASLRFNNSETSLINATLPKYSTEYTPYRFSQLEEKPFDSTDTRKRILIIGDSYAQDLINALYESGFDSSLQFTTRIISKRCGNLFISQSDFIKYIDVKYLDSCAKQRIFEDRHLRKRMREADEIWMASSWLKWQANLVQHSVANLTSFTKKPVKIFGRKNLGEINPRKLLEMSIKERYSFFNNVPHSQVEVNEIMKATLDKKVFIDVQNILCGDDIEKCPPFTDTGLLISYDGTHLTKDGATFYGLMLKSHPLLKGYIKK